MKKIFGFLVGTLIIVFGVYLWMNPVETLLAYSMYHGIAYLIIAVVTLVFVLYFKIRPIPYFSLFITFATGATILSLPLLTLTFLTWLFIAIFLGGAIFAFVRLYQNRENHNYVYILIAALAVIYGLVMLFNPTVAINTMARMIAVLVVINGITYLVPTRSY